MRNATFLAFVLGAVASTSWTHAQTPPLKTYPRPVFCPSPPPARWWIRYDPWTTTAVPMGSTYTVAFRLSTADVSAVTEVRFVLNSSAPGMEVDVAGFGPWVVDAAVALAAETASPAPPGQVWRGYSSTTTAPVAAGILADFFIRTTEPGISTSSNGFDRKAKEFFCKNFNEVRSGPSPGVGTLTDVFPSSSDCPAISPWGAGAIVMLLGFAGVMMFRRLRAVG